MKRVLTVIGTRPEALKMLPILRVLAADSRFESRICVTGQHRGLLDPLNSDSDLTVHHNLDVYAPDQSLAELTSKVLRGVHGLLEEESPHVMLVHGDTATAFAAALAAFYANIPIAHVEAGLRTHNMRSPWPEEGHRRLVDHLSMWHFAPTSLARDALLGEGVRPDRIWVVGNTAIDAVRQALLEAPSGTHRVRTPFILVTMHRRESHGDGVSALLRALREIATTYPTLDLVFVLHPNPAISAPAQAYLSDVPNVRLLPPVGHVDFVQLLRDCLFVLTDSGGIQEEATYLGKPLLVLRDVTERPEGVAAGTALLVGTDTCRIVEMCGRLLDNAEALERMSAVHHPYGNGRAAESIVDTLAKVLEGVE